MVPSLVGEIMAMGNVILHQGYLLLLRVVGITQLHLNLMEKCNLGATTTMANAALHPL